MRRGRESRSVNDAIIDVVIYSFAADVVALGMLALVQAFVPLPGQAAARVLVALLTLLLLPVAMAIGWSGIQLRMMRFGILRDTVADAWGPIFDGVRKGRLDLGVVVTFRDGRKLGGRLRRPATVDSYASEQHILLGEVWTIDQSCATFLEPVRGSFGILLEKADCETIQFFEWSQIDPHTDDGATTRGKRS
jgi:hypothetical protein